MIIIPMLLSNVKPESVQLCNVLYRRSALLIAADDDSAISVCIACIHLLTFSHENII